MTQEDFEERLLKALQDNIKVHVDVRRAKAYWDTDTVTVTVTYKEVEVSKTDSYPSL